MPDEPLFEAPNTPDPATGAAAASAPATGAAAPAAPQGAVAPPAGSPPTLPTTASAPAGDPGQPAQPGGQPGAQPAWWNSLGADETAAQIAVRQMQEKLGRYEQLDPYVNSYISEREGFHEYLRSKAKPQAAAPAAQQDPWYHGLGDVYRAPEFDPHWLTMVMETPEGRIVSKPGNPAEIGLKVEAYANYQRQVDRAFKANPAEFIKPIAAHVAQQVAQQIVAQQFGQAQEATTLSGFRANNAHWLYEREGTQFKTATRYNPNTGGYDTMPVMSAEGRRFVELVNERHAYQQSRGFRYDAQDQMQWAQTQLQNEFLTAQLRRQQTGAPSAPSAPAPAAPITREEANESWLKANGNGVHRANGNAAVTDKGAVLDFAGELRQQFAANNKRF